MACGKLESRGAAAARCFHNAICDAQMDNRFLSDVIRAEVRHVLSQSNVVEAVDILGLSGGDQAALDAAVQCPLVLQLSVAQAICHKKGIAGNQCGDGMVENKAVWSRLRERIAAGPANRL